MSAARYGGYTPESPLDARVVAKRRRTAASTGSAYDAVVWMPVLGRSGSPEFSSCLKDYHERGEGLIASGTFGTVKRVCAVRSDMPRDCEFAVKTVPFTDWLRKDMFQREVYFAKTLSPLGAAVNVVDAWTCDNAGFALMPLYNGTLEERFAMNNSDRAVDEPLRVSVADRRRIASVLDVLSDSRVVHGDCHLKNWLWRFEKDDTIDIRLADFGTSWRAGDRLYSQPSTTSFAMRHCDGKVLEPIIMTPTDALVYNAWMLHQSAAETFFDGRGDTALGYALFDHRAPDAVVERVFALHPRLTVDHVRQLDALYSCDWTTMRTASVAL